MSIKRAGLLFLFSLFAVYCAKENEKPSHAIVVDLKSGGDCLANFGDHISTYFNGKKSDTDVNAFWDCTAKAVHDYQRLTSGEAREDRYSPEAIRGFLQRYFIKGAPLSDSMMAQVMEIKRVLLNGSTKEITREELTRLQDLLMLLEKITREMNPHVKVLIMRAKTATDKETAEAGDTFRTSMGRLGQWLSAQRQPYTFAQLEFLIDEVEKHIDDKAGTAETFAAVRKALTVLPAAKKILIAGEASEISGHEWSPLMSALGLGYEALLDVNYAFSGQDLSGGLARGALPGALKSVAQLFADAVKLHPGENVPAAEFEELFAKVSGNGWLPEDFTVPGLMNAWRWLLKRPLGGGKIQGDALKEAHTARLFEVASAWLALHRSVSDGTALPRGPLAEKFRTVLDSSPPLEWDKENRLQFPLKYGPQWSVPSKLNMLWPFVAINWMKEAFAGEQAARMDGDQMFQAAEEILPVFKKFGWLKETEAKIGRKLLRESDLFTMASNGDGFIQVPEGSHYLAFIASAFRSAEVWKKTAKSACPDAKAGCLRTQASDLKTDILAPLPRLKSFLAADTFKRFTVYSKAAEETILGAPMADDETFGTGDLLQVWMIYQYVETFIRHFDVNSSEFVNYDESQPAFQLFGSTLRLMLEKVGVPEDEIIVFFTFLMKYGDTPYTMFGGQALYNHLKWHRNDWAFESDRMVLIGILNQLSKF